MKQFHVSIAAEAYAAALFSQAGCDVSVQYGANQPEYDLLITKDDYFLKVSVKGSQDGGWGLVQSYKKGRSYSEAIEFWANKHSPNTVYCLVQFYGVQFGQMPRIYLATVNEIANILKSSRKGKGYTSLAENYKYKKGELKDWNDKVPENWIFNIERVDKLFKTCGLTSQMIKQTE